MFKQYRILHGSRIKDDRSGKPGSTIAIEKRLGWANCEWLESCNLIAGMLLGKEPRLCKWGIVEREVRIGGCHGHNRGGCHGHHRVDTFLLETAETLGRTFAGLVARSFSLWLGLGAVSGLSSLRRAAGVFPAQLSAETSATHVWSFGGPRNADQLLDRPRQGGVYAQVALLAACVDTQNAAIERAERIFPRLLALESVLASSDCPSEVREFSDRFLWFRTVPYRELMCLISEGHVEEAVLYSWRVHGSTHHEKGRSC
jgi:hypothetical protein